MYESRGCKAQPTLVQSNARSFMCSCSQNFCSISFYPVIPFFLYIYNHFHNIFRLFDVLPNFTFIVSETMRDYYLQIWYIWVDPQVAEWLKTWDLRKLGNIRKMSKLHKMKLVPSLPAKMKILLMLSKTFRKIAIKLFL